MKRLIALLLALIASSILLHAEQAQTRNPAVQPAAKTPNAAVVDPASLLGLTRPQVEARLGAPSATFARIWSYKQPNGTLHVRFSKAGVVSDTKTNVETASSGKGYTSVAGQPVGSPKKVDPHQAGSAAKAP